MDCPFRSWVQQRQLKTERKVSFLNFLARRQLERLTFRRALGSVSLERLVEHVSELGVGLVVSVFVGPSLRGIEEFRRNSLESGGNREVEDGGLLELALGEGTVVDRVDDLAGNLERTTFSSSESSSSPALFTMTR